MKIILANPRGFCAGVNMAIECLERALDFFGPPLYVYHEIVHNKFVVERFRQSGTVFVEYTSLALLITLFALTVLSQFGGGPAPN